MARFHGTLLMTLKRRRVYIKNEAIEIIDFLTCDPGRRGEHHYFTDEALKELTQDLLASVDDTERTADRAIG
jgi:hypothetical protein